MRIRTFSIFAAITRSFITDYRRESLDLFDYVSTVGITNEVLEQEAVRRLEPLFINYFNKSAMAGNTLVQRQVATLSNALRVPFKYNKDVINQINGVSVFQGYYNQTYSHQFSRGEIDRLKKTILQGTYNNLDERALARDILNIRRTDDITKTIEITERRAQLLARNETQRLRESTKAVFAAEPEVAAKFNRVWFTQGDANVRPEHQAMEGSVADDKGMFYSQDVGYIAGPGTGPTHFAVACRCRTEFVAK